MYCEQYYTWFITSQSYINTYSKKEQNYFNFFIYYLKDEIWLFFGTCFIASFIDYLISPPFQKKKNQIFPTIF